MYAVTSLLFLLEGFVIVDVPKGYVLVGSKEEEVEGRESNFLGFDSTSGGDEESVKSLVGKLIAGLIGALIILSLGIAYFYAWSLNSDRAMEENHIPVSKVGVVSGTERKSVTGSGTDYYVLDGINIVLNKGTANERVLPYTDVTITPMPREDAYLVETVPSGKCFPLVPCPESDPSYVLYVPVSN